jgi:hypothetical protein
LNFYAKVSEIETVKVLLDEKIKDTNYKLKNYYDKDELFRLLEDFKAAVQKELSKFTYQKEFTAY